MEDKQKIQNLLRQQMKMIQSMRTYFSYCVSGIPITPTPVCQEEQLDRLKTDIVNTLCKFITHQPTLPKRDVEKFSTDMNGKLVNGFTTDLDNGILPTVIHNRVDNIGSRQQDQQEGSPQSKQLLTQYSNDIVLKVPPTQVHTTISLDSSHPLSALDHNLTFDSPPSGLLSPNSHGVPQISSPLFLQEAETPESRDRIQFFPNDSSHDTFSDISPSHFHLNHRSVMKPSLLPPLKIPTWQYTLSPIPSVPLTKVSSFSPLRQALQSSPKKMSPQLENIKSAYVLENCEED